MFTKILCAIDGSPDAGRALEIAGAMAAEAGTSIDVVHVIEYFSGGRVAGLTTRFDEPEIRERINAQVASCTSHGLQCVTHLPHAAAGKTSRRIAGLAVELGSDVIVIGTRGQSALAGALLGSVTQKLLHESPCPVLAIPPVCAPAAGPVGSGDAVVVTG